MVRRCCVESCNESDLTLLAHRFPKSDQMALQWQNALNLHSIPLKVLRQNFVVCTKHFSNKAYRNAISNSLNTTALPSTNIHHDNERIKIRIKDKDKEVPIRCHKQPDPPPKPSTSILKEDDSPELKKQKLDIEYFEDTINFTLLKTPIEEPPGKSEPLLEEIYEEVPYEDYKNEQILLPDVVSTSTQTEINTVELGIQTDKLKDPKLEAPPTESKDVKLINLLYPEYGGKTKMELIKMIIEKSQKIKSLDEEKQMLEDAMRKLL